MRFWDSSAIVAVLLEENRTREVRDLLDRDPYIIASFVTPVEIASALWRRRHARELSAQAHQFAETAFANLSQGWFEIRELDHVLPVAFDLLARRTLRASDALQLAAAVVARASGARLPFVTLDQQLAAAARAEGFPVLP